jgi:hypothetical protein
METKILEFNTPTDENGRIYHNKGKIPSKVKVYNRYFNNLNETQKEEKIIGEAEIIQKEDGLYAKINLTCNEFINSHFTTLAIGNVLKDGITIEEYELVGLVKKI